MRVMFILLASTFIMGCAGLLGVQKKLTDEGQQVKLIKSDPPENCKELGDVTGRGNTKYAKIGIRNKAANMGANVVRLETVGDSWMSGTAYNCPN